MVVNEWFDCIIEWEFLEVIVEMFVGLMVVVKKVIFLGGSVVVVLIKVVLVEVSILVFGIWIFFRESIVKLYFGKDVVLVDFIIDEEGFKMVVVVIGTLVNFGDGFWYGVGIFIVVVILVLEFGKWRVDLRGEGLFVCRDMLVFFNLEVKWENELVLDFVVFKWLGNDVGIVVIDIEGGVFDVLAFLDDLESVDIEEFSL